jgi:GT2 family glycosyltransferase
VGQSEQANGAVPGVSVIVPVYNGGEAFRECLASLAALDPPPLEVLVLEDGAGGDSGDVAREAGFTVVPIAARGGPARARNLGAARARGDVLFFVDADVTVSPDAVGRVAAYFGANEDVSAILGSYDDQPGATNFLSQYRNLLHHYVHQTGEEKASTFWGACGAVRREAFAEVGGLDETYRVPCVEDIELGYRLTAAGHEIRLVKDLQVKHWKVWTVRSMLKADVVYRALPWTQLLLQHRRIRNDLNLRTGSRISVLAAFALVGCLVAAWWWPWSLAVAAAPVAVLIAANAPLYAFFRRKRGLGFALRALPWHWLYFLYGGVAFCVGLIRYAAGYRRATWTGATDEVPQTSPAAEVE